MKTLITLPRRLLSVLLTLVILLTLLPLSAAFAYTSDAGGPVGASGTDGTLYAFDAEGSSGAASTGASGTPLQADPVICNTDKPMQSDTVFIVALDPAFADEVLAGRAELFMISAGETDYVSDAVTDNGNGNSNGNRKKLPPGLLKKESSDKAVHIRNLERYRDKHLAGSPVLLTVEV